MRRFNAGLILIALGGAAVAAEAPHGVPLQAQAVADTASAADSLYRAGRSALNRERYQEASDAFRRVYDQHPGSRHAGDAMYWHAFSLYRLGGLTNLRVALARLDRQAERYPAASSRGDARVLATRIRGELAQRGDADAARSIAAAATGTAEADAARAAAAAEARGAATGATSERAAAEAARASARAVRPPRPPRPPRAPAAPDECENEDDTRTAALHALLQMDEARATPILKKILARRDSGSVCLRRRAVFMVSQKGGSETGTILLDAARNDPDPEVRGQAVFWLGQTGAPEAVALLDSIARTSDDPEVQGRALFGLGQSRDEQATRALRAFVERNDTDPDLKAKAIFWLGQRGGTGNGEFLRTHFARTTNEDVRNQILFAISQDPSPENQRWLLGLAKDTQQPIETRKQALFWAANQGDLPTADLAELYRTVPDRDMRTQLVFVLSQRDDPEAIGELIRIARTAEDPEVRKQAVFWLGQSDDPRATDFLVEVLEQ